MEYTFIKLTFYKRRIYFLRGKPNRIIKAAKKRIKNRRPNIILK